MSLLRIASVSALSLLVGAAEPAARATPPASTAAMASVITFNGRVVKEDELRIIARIEETVGIEISAGHYWYDARSEAAGHWGGPTRGLLALHLKLGGPLTANASRGGNGRLTGVFVNGRELHTLDVEGLRLGQSHRLRIETVRQLEGLPKLERDGLVDTIRATLDVAKLRGVDGLEGVLSSSLAALESRGYDGWLEAREFALEVAAERLTNVMRDCMNSPVDGGGSPYANEGDSVFDMVYPLRDAPYKEETLEFDGFGGWMSVAETYYTANPDDGGEVVYEILYLEDGAIEKPDSRMTSVSLSTHRPGMNEAK
jgi:hypothetical protein